MSLYPDTRDPREAFTCQFPPNSCPGGCGAQDPEDCQCCPDCGDYACSCSQSKRLIRESETESDALVARQNAAWHARHEGQHDSWADVLPS
jgi:hypothetical protein